MQDKSSIEEVFSTAFVLSKLEISDFSIEFQGQPGILAASMMEFYDVFVLSAEAQTELERRLFEEFKTQENEGKRFGYTIGLRKIVAQKK